MKYLITTICVCGFREEITGNEKTKIHYLEQTKLLCPKCLKLRRFSFSVIPVITTETKDKIKVELAK